MSDDQSIIEVKYALRDKWKYLEKYLKHNMMYMLYYRWFLKDYLNQDVTINEDYVNALLPDSEKQNNVYEDYLDDNTLGEKKQAYVFYPDTFIVHIRMDLHNPGEIVSVNRSSYNFTGYEQNELVKQKINILMPKVISDAHDVILRQYITLGITFTNNKIDTYIQVKDKTIKPVNLLIKLYYKMSGNIEMVGLFREVKHRLDNPEIIVFENNGKINSMTRPLIDELGLVPSIFSQYDYNIMISLPELKDHYLKNSTYVNRDIDVYDNLKIIADERANNNQRKSIDLRNIFNRQTTNRSNQSGGTRIGDLNNDRQSSQAEFFNDVTGLDTETKEFGLILRMPFTLPKVLEEFTSMMNSKEKEKDSKMMIEQKGSIKSKSSRVELNNKEVRQAPPVNLSHMFSKLGGSLNKKENEIVIIHSP